VSERVLVTGATGFVGRQVVRRLAARGCALRLIVRRGREAEAAALPNVESIVSTADLFAEPEEWGAAACRDVQRVIHLAWFGEPGAYLESEQNLDCLAGTLRLAKGAALAAVPRFVGIGTCMEYDLTGGPVSVATPLRPVTAYAAAKAATFLALSQWFPLRRVEFAWCRLFYLYGEGEHPARLIPYVESRLAAGEPAELTSGEQTRDYLDVGAAAGQIVDVTFGTVRGAVNVCSGVPVTVRQLVERIADRYGRRDLLRFGSRPKSRFDPPYVVGVPGPGHDCAPLGRG
jgi:nucleoside-diphosphate-sugar epimerase